ncbi:class I SAM-dependent methyltransferase [Candidatus Bathyarchaeota archaeon]|nr:class I SAM-dependent methyltransferase [Candidatus Bathyarchaeota archaeon]
MNSSYEEWDQIYRRYPLESLPWELGKPRKILVNLVEKGIIKKGKALDICCGAGTNAVYLAQIGFDMTGIDISSKAIEYAEQKAEQANVKIRLMVQNFLTLPFQDEEFDFVFDMGCFHHVEVKDRNTFIKGVYRVLKKGGTYLLVCFSYRNGPAWNHFTREQIIQLYSNYFKIKEIKHITSREADDFVRYFYVVLMERK